MKKVKELELVIVDIIKQDNGRYVSIKYNKSDNDYFDVAVYTVDSNAGSFLMHSAKGWSKEECLHQIYIWLLNKHKLKSWTVEWVLKGKTVKSYFYATSIRTVLEKFYATKTEDSHSILGITLNPES